MALAPRIIYIVYTLTHTHTEARTRTRLYNNVSADLIIIGHTKPAAFCKTSSSYTYTRKYLYGCVCVCVCTDKQMMDRAATVYIHYIEAQATVTKWKTGCPSDIYIYTCRITDRKMR